MPGDALAVARRCYQAYVDKDRATLEALMGDEFHFTSPLDNRLDRATYFERCWPNSECLAGFDLLQAVQDVNRVFVSYEARTTQGKRFRNTEILTIQQGRLVDVEVFFGWSIPHEAPNGGFIAQ